MKRVKLVLAFLIALAYSCSGDDDGGSEGEDVVLIEKITETVYYGEDFDVNVTLFDYDENGVLQGTTRGNYQTQFVWADDQIAFMKRFLNGTQTSQTGFVYENDRLIQMNGENGERTNFTYSNGNLSTVQSQYFDEDVWVTQSTETFEFNGNNDISKRTVIADFGGGMTSDFRFEFAYDDKPSPMRDMNKYVRMIGSFEGFDPKNSHNATARVSYSPSTGTTPTGTQTYTIEYNEDNFPVLIEKHSSGGNLISSTTIEYIQN